MQSLEELKPIIQMLTEVKGKAIADVPILLVGNKSDETAVSYSPSRNVGPSRSM